MKKTLLFIITVTTALVCGCGMADNHGVTEPSGNVTDNTTAAEKETQNSLSEDKLLEIMEKECQNTIENHVYADMDNDGNSELIGTFADANSGIHYVWYCSSDGNVCGKVTESTAFFDSDSVSLIEYENFTHVIVNYYNMMGDYKQFTILGLKDGEIVMPVRNMNGFAEQAETGIVNVIVEAYDGYYDASIDALIEHTWKNAYIFYDESAEKYKEYGATAISEEEFVKYENADKIMNDIKNDISSLLTGTVEFKYYLRSNGILEIQCADKSTSNDISYYYYSITCKDGKITGEITDSCNGQVMPCYTGLEAVY